MREGDICPVDRTDDTVTDVRWFADNFELSRKSFSFVRADRDLLARQPFLDYRWKTDGLPRREISLDEALTGLPAGAEPAGLNFIWHTSFCCSTSIAKALDLAGRNLSLCEPQILIPIADLKRAGMFANNSLSPRLPEIVFRFLAADPQQKRKSWSSPATSQTSSLPTPRASRKAGRCSSILIWRVF